MQEHVWRKRGEQYLLFKSSPASGKSRAMMFVALDKLANQKLQQAIIVVPEKANAKKDPTYLLADVKVVATYKLANINRRALESLLHKVFAGARLDLALKDRLGAEAEPRKRFIVPLSAIDEAIEKVENATPQAFRYHPQTQLTVPSHPAAG